MFFGEEWPQSKLALVDLTRGMRSKHFQSGPLAPADYEGPIWDFYRYMRRTLGPALRAHTTRM